MGNLEPYEIYAIRYGHLERNASANFLGGDPHDGPMPLDYFVWAITGPVGTFILDTGFQSDVGARRGREFLADPAQGLQRLGIQPAQVEDVIISHMHYDHGGNLDIKALGAGSTLYLPVFNKGAQFSAGDGHALQGDGEVDGDDESGDGTGDDDDGGENNVVDGHH